MKSDVPEVQSLILPDVLHDFNNLQSQHILSQVYNTDTRGRQLQRRASFSLYRFHTEGYLGLSETSPSPANKRWWETSKTTSHMLMHIVAHLFYNRRNTGCGTRVLDGIEASLNLQPRRDTRRPRSLRGGPEGTQAKLQQPVGVFVSCVPHRLRF